MDFTNAQVAKLLRTIAAVLTLKKVSIFQIRAYENAADAIEHLTANIQDLWEEKKLDDIPGVGQNLQSHLNELFETGKVKHFDELTRNLPPVFADLLDIPGIGPKTAEKLAQTGIKNLDELKQLSESGKLLEEGLSEKTIQNVLTGLKTLASRGNRMLLSTALEYANQILDYLKKCPDIKRVESLGSLRRKVPTIGDLDFAASSDNPKKVIEYFVKLPGTKSISGKGENKATIELKTGVHVDLLVGSPSTYGALLQHFTGSKHHNIKLRTLAEEKGYSISENGIKNVKSEKVISIHEEQDLYNLLGMETPVPEMREDTGEVEAAINHKLPKVIEYGSLRGDLHLHSSYKIEPSHDLGENSMEEIVQKGIKLGYEYIGISDHSPSVSNHSKEEIVRILEKRSRFIQDLRKKFHQIKILIGLEADIQGDGSISVPDEGLELLDYCIVGVHSQHRMDKDKMTKRLTKALENPYVTILAHPTGRLLNQRDSSEANWKYIFELAKKFNKILEINSHPERLDLRDDLVKEAVGMGVKLIINSDAHQITHMDNLDFGISVARRGWAESSDVVNSMNWKNFCKCINIKT